MNTMNYQMLKEVKWTTNLILLNYFLRNITMISGLKMKNRLIKSTDLRSKRRKRIKNFNPKQITN